MEVVTHPAAAGVTEHRYTLTRALDETVYGSRHLVLSSEHHTSHLLHRLDRVFPAKPGARERFERVMVLLQRADHPHILRVEEFGWDAELGPFTISDYTGDADGIVTLDRLLTLKGGSLTLEETKRVLEQLMGACAAAHTAGAGGTGVYHGALTMSQVHVDRRGSLLIELYGLNQELVPTRTAAGDEVRSIAAIGYQLATALLPLRPLIPVEHMIDPVDQTWRDYFLTGLAEGGAGFSTAAHALAAVQGLRIAGAGGIGEMRSSLRDLIRSMLTPVR
ncbi:MAG: hypothetical protein Q8L55_01850 [Phycisphaerales bacterium]|nr:hypothetical protein [Phycisphaerales bacterium]